MTRILLADDSSAVRQGLRKIIERHREWHVCGEAVNGRDAVEKVGDLQPDLVIMDFAMPLMNGLDAAREISRRFQNIPVLICSLYVSERLTEEARHAGARGVVSKTEIGRLTPAVEALLLKQQFFAGS
jgi:DNA-binding NarL/FixJ family response regulator